MTPPRLYVIAENRWAYNSWCDRNGHKWFHHIYVHDGPTINTLDLSPERFVFVDGWENNPKAARIKAGYNAATIRQHIADQA